MPLYGQFFTKARITSVTALQAQANLNAIPAGYYLVKASVYLSGTAPADGVDDSNLVLSVDNVLQSGRLFYPAVAGQRFDALFNVFTLGTNILLVAAALGTVGTIYNTALSIVPLGNQFASETL